MKLLLVVHSMAKRGGMEAQVGHLAAGLAKEGHLVRLASMRSRDPVAGESPELSDPRVEVIHLGATGRTAGLVALRRLASLARWSDVVHCTGWDASLWGRLAAVLARRPVIVAEHTPGRAHQVSSSGAPRQTFIEWHNRVLDPFTSLTVICAEWQREMLRGEGVAAEKIVCIPNGVPVDELTTSARTDGTSRAALGIPETAKVVAHVARFEPQKRQLLSLQTVARLRDSMGDVRVVFAGEGTQLEGVREAARDMGADWAIFLGRHDNVPSIFAMADVAVLPSTAEALPMAILEAIAVGVPVVASDVGDVGETLRRTGAGLSVPAGDPDAFYAACRAVLTDRALHDRLVSAARASRSDIDASTMVRSYDELLSGYRPVVSA